jgi:hypothetical protein
MPSNQFGSIELEIPMGIEQIDDYPQEMEVFELH